MRSNPVSITRSESALAVNRVLRNTYLLLSLTLLFSAGMAAWAIVTNAPPFNFIALLVGMFGLYFLTTWLRNSAWGLVAIFAYTGFMGYTLGPVLNFYIHNFSNGSQIIMTSLGATGLIFLGLSAYALTTRKNFSYMGGFITVAVMVAFLLGLGAMIFNIPLLQLFISGAFAVLSSAFILYTTSQIIHDGERNYIMATISLYISIFNLFVNLLRILSFFGGGNNRN
ncbi:MAG: Bax inhibitor-1/YccA family protein [Proteobacteria bacterium]|nr:Bax inhibitor-1/YccA family protein [Pseudomonadota bacterium]